MKAPSKRYLFLKRHLSPNFQNHSCGMHGTGRKNWSKPICSTFQSNPSIAIETVLWLPRNFPASILAIVRCFLGLFECILQTFHLPKLSYCLHSLINVGGIFDCLNKSPLKHVMLKGIWESKKSYKRYFNAGNVLLVHTTISS